MKPFYKLVRDRIPEIIEADGKTCVCETLSDEEYIRLLDQKLNEELAEYPVQSLQAVRGYAEMLHHTRTLGVVQADESVWKKLTQEEKQEIQQICDEKLASYYKRL